nr:cysteine-rich receptor-like protein kinase 42 [Ipomoea batatas]
MIMKVGQNSKLVILRSCVVIFLSGMSRIFSLVSRTILVLLRLAWVRCLRGLDTAIFSGIALTIISNLGRLMVFPRDQHPCSITWFGLCKGGVSRWLRMSQRTGSNCRSAIGVRDVHCAVQGRQEQGSDLEGAGSHCGWDSRRYGGFTEPIGPLKFQVVDPSLEGDFALNANEASKVVQPPFINSSVLAGGSMSSIKTLVSSALNRQDGSSYTSTTDQSSSMNHPQGHQSTSDGIRSEEFRLKSLGFKVLHSTLDLVAHFDGKPLSFPWIG